MTNSRAAKATIVLALALIVSARGGEESPQAGGRIFDSLQPLTVAIYGDGWESIFTRTTPTLDGRGLFIPPGARWGVEFTREAGSAAETGKLAPFFAEIRAQRIPRFLCDGAVATDLAALAACTHLEGLRLSSDQLVDDDLKSLSALVNLRQLQLCCPKVTEAGLAHLAALGKLEEFRWDGPPMTCVGLTHLARLPALRELQLHAYATPRPDPPFEKCPPFPSLVRLTLSGYRFRYLDLVGLHGWPVLRRVECPTGTLVDLVGRERAAYNLAFEIGSGWERALTAEKRQRIEALIAQLNADDFETRVTARDELSALTPHGRAYLLQRTAALVKNADLDPEVLHGLTHALSPFPKAQQKVPQARRCAELLKDLRSIDENVPFPYRPPDPETRRALKNKVSFEFVDCPIHEAAEEIGRMAQLAVVVDPACPPGLASINLRVTDMDARLGLMWVGRLLELEAVPWGPGVVFTTRERANLLSQVLVPFPAPGGEARWSAQEMERVSELLKWAFDARLRQTATPGTVSIQAPLEKHTSVREFLGLLGRPPWPPTSQLNAWVGDSEARLNAQVELPGNSKPREWAEAIGKAIGGKITLKISDVGFRFPVPTMRDTSARQVLLALCHSEQCALWPVIPSHAPPGRLLKYCMGHVPELHMSAGLLHVNLRPALEAGVKQDQLLSLFEQLIGEAQLTEVAREGGGARPWPKGKLCDYVFRGRFIYPLDPWTFDRAVKVVQAAAKTGRLPDLPPAPWFFETFPKER